MYCPCTLFYWLNVIHLCPLSATLLFDRTSVPPHASLFGSLGMVVSVVTLRFLASGFIFRIDGFMAYIIKS